MDASLIESSLSYLKPGADHPTTRSLDESNSVEMHEVILGGGVAARWTGGARTVPATVRGVDVEIIKFCATGSSFGEYADSSWWERADYVRTPTADRAEHAKLMIGSWGRVNKESLPVPFIAPPFPGTRGAPEAWEALKAHVVQLHNEGRVPGFLTCVAKAEWLQQTSMMIYPTLRRLRDANYQALQRTRLTSSHACMHTRDSSRAAPPPPLDRQCDLKEGRPLGGRRRGP